MLKSVLIQTEQPICVIVDDGSTIDIKAILSQFDNSFFKYLRREKRKGDLRTSSYAMNLGLDQLFDEDSVLSELEKKAINAITYVHSDDYMPDDSLANRLTTFKDDTGFVWGDRIYVNLRNHVLHFYKTDFYASRPMHKMEGFPNHTIMWSKNFLVDLKNHRMSHQGVMDFFDENLGGYEDLDLSMASFELAKIKGLSPVNTGYVNYVYTSHSDNITGSLSGRNLDKYRVKVLLRYITKRELRQLNWGNFRTNLPWSLFHKLPEIVKKPFRQIVNLIKFKKKNPLTEKNKLDRIWNSIPEGQRSRLKENMEVYNNQEKSSRPFNSRRGNAASQ